MRRVGALLALLVALLAFLAPSASADSDELPGLSAGTRVYDESGRSLTDAQAAALQQRLDELQTRAGADVVVLVRDLDATPEETFDQAEALQQAWVRATDGDQDTTGAIVVDREPGTDDEARAGLFVGSTYDDGNVPRREQEDIVEQTLIPPLRDGDVERSLTGTVDRLERDIREGPPEDDSTPSFWQTDPGFAAGHLVVVLAGYVAVVLLRRSGPRGRRATLAPTTRRPDAQTSPHAAAALAFDHLGTAVVSACALVFAARGALVFEQAPRRRGRRPVLRARLTGPGAPRDEVERTVWAQLEERARDGVVAPRSLQRMAGNQVRVRREVKAELRRREWLAPHRIRTRVLICVLGVVALPVAIVGFGIGSPWVAAAALVLAPFSWLLAATYPTLSGAARDEGSAWRAYRAGLSAASTDDLRARDVDDLVPDLAALGLSRRVLDVVDRDTGLDRESDSGPLLGSGGTSSLTMFQHTFIPPSGGGSFSGGGAGGGGGAAGST